MENDVKKLIELTLNHLKTDLEKKVFPAEKFFEYENHIVLFSLKEIDDILALSVGVNKEGTDLMFSNFLSNGNTEDIKSYLDKTDTVDNIQKTLSELILKTENYD